MDIAAALCWYDEPPETLRRVVASVAPIVSCIVAMDGAWEGFPHDSHLSPIEQSQALREACAEHSLDLHEVPVQDTLRSQSYKRSLLYQEACKRAKWVLVIDADEHLSIVNLPHLRSRLTFVARSKASDAMTMRVSTPGVDGSKGGGLTATAPSGTRWQPRLFRSNPSIAVGPYSHRTLSVGNAIIQCGSVEDLELYEDAIPARIERARGVSIINSTHSRDAQRIAAKRAYGKARHERGID